MEVREGGTRDARTPRMPRRRPPVGRSTPFTAMVPVTTPPGPEDWEFQTRAVKRDVEIGVPSMIVPQAIRG